jgi:hypothetical protein
MLVTPSGIATLVSPRQPRNADFPILVTLHPPNFGGMVIAPTVDLGTAVNSAEPPPTLAHPFLTVYVHVIPSTVSVSAKSKVAAQSATAVKMDLMMLACFISRFSFSLQQVAIVRFQ